MLLKEEFNNLYTDYKDFINTNGIDGVLDEIKVTYHPENINSGKPAINMNDLDESGNTKYSFINHTYPSDLLEDNNKYGGNRIVFFINVPEDSYIIKDNKTTTVDIDNKETIRGYSSELGSGDTNAVDVGLGLGVGITAGKLASDKLTKILFNGGKLLKSATSAGTVGGLAAASLGLLTDGKMSRPVKRLKSAIALYMPQSLSIRYNSTWSDSDMFLPLSGMEISAELAESFKNKTIPHSATSTIAAGILKTPLIGGYLSAASGLTTNPKKENIFKGVDFRILNFEFTFSPKNNNEEESIKRIIKTFKLHMHPEFKDEKKFMYIYPSEFDIGYYHYNSENTSLHRHTSCILTEMTVNYTPNSNFNTFDNGCPTQIQVQMVFKELGILTKKDIEDNF